MKILLMHQTVAAHDAIGNDIAYMAELFSEEQARRQGKSKGIDFQRSQERETKFLKGEVVVYCEFRKKEGYSYVNRNEALEILKHSENLVIYHHSGYWEDGERLLREARGENYESWGEQGELEAGVEISERKKAIIPARLVIRYHNVTPPEFFADYSAFYFQNCTKGRKQTERLEESFPEAWWLCDSAYNAKELTKVPEGRKKRLHPFHNLTAWENILPDRQVMDTLKKEQAIKVLFTGRIVPNKGHLSLIDMLEEFRENYGDRMVLYIIGKPDGSVSFYTEEVKRRILAAGLEKRVRFVGEVTDETLLAYYKGCDYYVSFSDHEGFGVPFIEAQYLELPVIAKAAAAAGEVLGDGALLFKNEISHYSAAIAYLEERPKVRQELIQAGRENCVSRYDNEKAGKELLDWLEAGEQYG